MDLEPGGKSSSRRSSRHSLFEANAEERTERASRKSSRVSQASDQIREERSSRRSSVASSQNGRRSSSRRNSQASTPRRGNSRESTPDDSSAIDGSEETKRPERIRNKKKEFSPEVSGRKSSSVVAQKVKPRKSATSSPALTKREAKPKTVEQKEPFLMSDGNKALKTLPQQDFVLDKDNLPKIEKEAQKRSSVEVESPNETEGSNEEEDDEPEEPEEDTNRAEIEETGGPMEDVPTEAPKNRKRPRTIRDSLVEAFSTPPPVEEKPLMTEKPKEKKRQSKVIKEEPRESPPPEEKPLENEKSRKSKAKKDTKEPASKRVKITRRSSAEVEEESEPEESTPQDEGEGRKSRRSAVGFKEFMAKIKGTPRSETQQVNKSKGEIKLARTKKLKEPKMEPDGEAEEPNEFEPDKALPPTPDEEKEEEPLRKRQSSKTRKIDDSKKDEEDTPGPSTRSLRKNSRSEKAVVVKRDPSPITSASSTRRSGRNSISSTKQADISQKDKGDESTEKTEETPKTFKVKAKPGSALEILKKTSQYKRIERSPSPSGPLSSTKTTPEKLKETKEKTQESVEEAPIQAAIVEEKPFVNQIQTEQKPLAEEKPFAEKKPFAVPEEKPFSAASISTLMLNIVVKREIMSDEEFEYQEESTTHTPAQSTGKKPKGVIKITKTKKNAPSTPKQPVEKKPAVETPAVELAQPTRRSGRTLKPNLSADYVFDVPVIRNDSKKSSPVKTPTKPVKAVLKSPSPVKRPAEPEEESAAEKTRKYVEEHKGPIKLSFKIGSEVATVVKEADEETNEGSPEEIEELIEEDDEPREEEVEKPLVVSFEKGVSIKKIKLNKNTKKAAPPKSKRTKEPSWWTSYTPTPKPVLENFIRPDGTVEHLGVVVNSVMDNLLLKVCDDGIRRHSNNKAREARKQEMSEMAKKRYHERKKITEEKIARGEPVEPPKKTSAELFAHQISTRERTKKGALYKSNEYLLKPVKLQKEAEMEREKQEQEARDYLNKQFIRVAEEDLRNAQRNKRREQRDLTFQDFLKAKGKKTVETFAQHPNPDYFHREILMDVDVETSDGEVDENVDIELVDPEDPPIENVESALFLEQARVTSDQLCAMLPRHLNAEGECDILDAVHNCRGELPIRRAIIINSIEVLVEFHQAQMALEYTPGSTIKLHNDAIRKCYQLRDAFCSLDPEIEVMTWAHGYLLRSLPSEYLSCYLVLLRYWRYQPLSLVGSFSKRAFLQDPQPWPQVTETLWGYVGLRVIDPDREIIQETIDAEALSDVIFVLVPPSLQYGEYSFSTKAHDVLYRWLRVMGSKESYIVNMDYEEEQGEDVWQLIDFFVKKIKNEVAKLVRETRDKRIVLVGWRLSTYFNHRVVALTHGVSAIIDLAFPIMTGHGYRGEPDDEILLTYCPSLFIIGSGADDFNAIALKEMRVNMISESGSLILHRADNHLYVPTYILNRYGITMRTVYRGILDHIIEFLKLPSTKKERSQLIQVDIHNIYNVEIDAQRQPTAAGMQPQRIANQRATTDGRPNAPRQRKRKNDTLPLTLMPGHHQGQMPSLLAEYTPMGQTEQARYRFDEVVRNARIVNPTDLTPLTPKTAPAAYKTLNSPMASPRIINPTNLNRSFLAQQPSTSQPSKILDPANISLT